MADEPDLKSFSISTPGSRLFLENAGQVYDESGYPRRDVQYCVSMDGVSLYLRNAGMSYVFRQIERPEIPDERRDDQEWIQSNTLVNSYQCDVDFLNISPNCKIAGTDSSPWPTRFYVYPDQNWEIVAHHLRRVRYSDLYPGIDLAYYESNGKVKYDFIVHPGSQAERIRCRYTGGVDLQIGQHGNLVLRTPLGEVREAAPVAYQNDGIPVDCRFHLEGDVLSFELGEYDRSQDLVIDPALIWGTYYGGTGDDFIYQLAVDASDNVYAAGKTLSSNQISTPGALQTLNGGNQDAFVVKLDSSGTRQWATYYGASAYDEAWGIDLDASGNIFFGGKTDNTGMASGTVHQSTLGGAGDAILVKLNSAGVRQWATYYGGGSQDYGFRVSTDGSGNCYFVGYTSSITGIASLNAHQSTIGGSRDAFLAKFSNTGTLLWGTYYGGTGPDEMGSVTVGGSGNIYCAGNTQSATGIATPGVSQSTIGGSNDGFIAKFSANGTRTWGAYFGGTSYDRANYVVVDASGNIFFTGKTSSSSGIATSGAAQTVYGGGIEDAYVARMNGNGILQWATYAGGSGIDEGHGISIGTYGNIVITGNTGSSTGIATSGAFLSTYAGGAFDGYAIAHTTSGSKIWGGYFGGGAHDYGYSVCTAKAGMFYIAGRTQSTTGIATTGAHQTSLGGGFDGYIAKIKYVPAGQSITTGTVHPIIYCAGDSVFVPFTITGSFQAGNVFMAQLSDSGGSFTSPVALGTLPGAVPGTIAGIIPANTPSGTSYRIRVVSSIPSVIGTDNGTDIAIFQPPSVSVSPPGPVTICDGDSVMLSAQGNGIISYQWERDGVPIPGAALSSILARISGSYSVVVQNSAGCPAESDSIVIQVLPLPTVTVVPAGPHAICQGDSVVLQAISAAGSTLQWYKDSQVMQGATNDTLVVSQAGDYYVVAANASCQATSNVVQVTILPSPRADIFPPGPLTICQGSSVVLYGPSAVGYQYQWYKNGVSIPGASSISLTVTAEGSYAVLVINANSCSALSPSVIVTFAPSDPTKLVWTGSIDSLWTTVGNWDNPCAIPTTGDTVVIISTTNVPISSPPIMLSVLDLDNAAGLTLGGLLQITEELRLQHGNIRCGGHDVQIGSGAAVTNGSVQSFIVTDGAGRLVINGIGSGGPSVHFPVGFSSTDYVPLWLKNNGTTDQFSLRITQGVLQNGTSGNPVISHVVGVSWHLMELAAGGSNAEITFQWDGKHETSSFNRQKCAAAHFHGASWSVLQSYGVAQNTPAASRTVTSVTSFSPFTVTDPGSSIPVELASFTAHHSQDGIILHWVTESETENSGFEIQRHATPKEDWKPIGFVSGHGTSLERREYRFQDMNLVPGSYRYRLRQVDYSGESSFSRVLEVDYLSTRNAFELLGNYPNPFNPTTCIQWYMGAPGRARLQVFNSVGKLVEDRDLGMYFAGMHTFRYEASSRLSSGVVHYRLITPVGVATGTMVFLP